MNIMAHNCASWKYLLANYSRRAHQCS